MDLLRLLMESLPKTEDAVEDGGDGEDLMLDRYFSGHSEIIELDGEVIISDIRFVVFNELFDFLCCTVLQKILLDINLL